jgi:hypothetical protein
VRAAAALVALLGALALAACGGEDDDATSGAPAESAPATDTPATTGEAAATTATQEATAVDIEDSAGSRMVAIYLDLNEKVHPVRRLVGSGRPELRPVLEHLLAGPTPEELAAGYTSAIPPGVQLLGIEGEGTDTVTVDLSSQFGTVGTPLSAQLALAQLVHTVVYEKGPSVSVVVQLDGQPITALGEILVDGPQTVANVEDVTPPVLVQWPLPGDRARCPQRVNGTSNTFEATSLLGFTSTTDELPAGDPTIVTASNGNGTRGTFDVTVPCPDSAGETAYLVSWFGSAKDGSPQAVEHIPLVMP